MVVSTSNKSGSDEATYFPVVETDGHAQISDLDVTNRPDFNEAVDFSSSPPKFFQVRLIDRLPD
jgi:hypothetical protein